MKHSLVQRAKVINNVSLCFISSYHSATEGDCQQDTPCREEQLSESCTCTGMTPVLMNCKSAVKEVSAMEVLKALAGRSGNAIY